MWADREVSALRLRAPASTAGVQRRGAMRNAGRRSSRSAARGDRWKSTSGARRAAPSSSCGELPRRRLRFDGAHACSPTRGLRAPPNSTLRTLRGRDGIPQFPPHFCGSARCAALPQVGAMTMWEDLMNCICQNGPQRPGMQELLSTLERHRVCTGTQCFEGESEAFGLTTTGNQAPTDNTMFFMFMMCADARAARRRVPPPRARHHVPTQSGPTHAAADPKPLAWKPPPPTPSSAPPPRFMMMVELHAEMKKPKVGRLQTRLVEQPLQRAAAAAAARHQLSTKSTV